MDTTNPVRDGPAAPAPASYEFTIEQNTVIRRLASDMVWVGTPLVIVGILYALSLLGLVTKVVQQPDVILPVLLVVLVAVFYLALGTWTNRAAERFKKVATTEGQDIPHLMAALENLGKMYGLLSLLIKAYLVLTLVAVISIVAITALGMARP